MHKRLAQIFTVKNTANNRATHAYGDYPPEWKAGPGCISLQGVPPFGFLQPFFVADRSGSNGRLCSRLKSDVLLQPTR